MNIDVHNINSRTRYYEIHRVLAGILHSEYFSHLHTLPINFDLRVFQGQANHSLQGLLVLPTAGIGKRFLKEYGGAKPRFCVNVSHCRLSFVVSCEPIRYGLVSHLKKTPYIAPVALERQFRLEAKTEANAVDISAIQFGWETRDGAYSMEYEYPCAEQGTLSYDLLRRQLLVEVNQGKQKHRLVVRASLVSWAGCGKDRSPSTSVSLFLSLLHPPSYESQTPRRALRIRNSSLTPAHSQFTAFTSLSIRLVCGGIYQDQTLSKLRWLCATAQLQHRDHVHPLIQQGLFAPSRQSLYNRWLQSLPYAIAFQLDSMVHDNLLDLSEVLLLRPMIGEAQDTQAASYIVDLLQLMSFELRDDPSQTVMMVYERCKDNVVPFDPISNSSRGTDVFLCYHAIVTPSICIYQGPFLERANRVIRRYPGHSADFLRVSFVEEDRLQYRVDREVNCWDFLQRRVGGILKKGLYVAGRHFKFLAYSQSGLKSHSLWFVKDFMMVKDGMAVKVTPNKIIADLGTFKDIAHDPTLAFCPARLAARISQAFTTTDAAVIMEPDEILVIPDIYDADGKRCFTDGVGTISPELADDIWAELQRLNPRRARRNRPCPRAYQIRFRGSKGMLSVDYRSQGRVICIRQSMIKFESSHSQIEVVSSIDHSSPFYLNRPLIMLLEGLGAAGGFEYFQGLQDAVIKDTQDAMRFFDTAARLLEAQGLGASYRLTSVLLGIFKLGLTSLDNDIFIQKILKYAVYHILRELKHHARIPVPNGYTLVGVADVHGYLAEGEVFACVTAPGTREPIYLEGQMLIARSPVIHPGDVQVVRAIGRPPPGTPYDIEPLTNTIVFSVEGARPLASCLAGGDLDGDCFVCTTAEKMLPRRTFPAANYNPSKKKILKRPATTQDIIDFIVEYIYSDNIGVIATNWLITADHSEDGIENKACLILADLHSDATDYPKTGIPVPMDQIPRMRFKERPDWSQSEISMGIKNSSKYYKSQRWLGKLYRDVELPTLNEHRDDPEAQPAHDATPLTAQDVRDFLRTQLSNTDPLTSVLRRQFRTLIPQRTTYHRDEIEEMVSLLNAYTSQLRMICYNNSLSGRRPLDEAELVTGTILEKTSQPRARKEYMSQMREAATDLVSDVRDRLEVPKDSDGSWGQLSAYRADLRRAWIAYRVGSARSTVFGARSFRIIALGQFFDAMKHIEEIEASLRNTQLAVP